MWSAGILALVASQIETSAHRIEGSHKAVLAAVMHGFTAQLQKLKASSQVSPVHEFASLPFRVIGILGKCKSDWSDNAAAGTHGDLKSGKILPEQTV